MSDWHRAPARRWLIALIAPLMITAGCGAASTDAAPSSPAPSSPAAPTALSTTVPATSPATTSPAAPASCADTTLAQLSLTARAGQLLMIGTDVDAPSGLADLVAKYQLGGVFLHGRSTNSSATIHSGITALQRSAKVPLLVSLDQEGGEVQTLKGADFPIFPSAQALGAGSLSKLRSTVTDSAKRLAGAGITMNLAPVADTVPASLGKRNPPIGKFDRQYGSTPAAVSQDVGAVVTASQGAGVLTTLKHFPGLGRVLTNTDTAPKTVDSVTTTNDVYLTPFKTGIAAGSAAVMVSSAYYTKIDPNSIAAFSRPIITNLLRGQLGFKGLVVSDDIGAATAVANVAPGTRAVRFVEAGGDLVLSIRASDAAPMLGALLAKAEADPAFKAQVTEAARQVLAAKQKAGLLSCS